MLSLSHLLRVSAEVLNVFRHPVEGSYLLKHLKSSKWNSSKFTSMPPCVTWSLSIWLPGASPSMYKLPKTDTRKLGATTITWNCSCFGSEILCILPHDRGEAQDHREGRSHYQTHSRRRGKRPSLAGARRWCPLLGQKMESRCLGGEHLRSPLWERPLKIRW